MTFDAKQLKEAVETVRLPEDMGERLLETCKAANGPTNEAKRGSSAARKALLAGIAACAVLVVGFGLWRAGGNRLWRKLWGTTAEIVQNPSEATSQEMGAVGSPTEESAPPKEEGSSREESMESTGESPLVSICLYTREELEEMREIAQSADDAELEAYLRRLGLLYAVHREDLLAFSETLETLPYLPILEGAPACIKYLPELPDLILTLEGAQGDRVKLEYELYFNNPERLATYLRDLAAEMPSQIDPFTCCDGRVTVYVEGRFRDRDGQDFIIWYAIVDGILVGIRYDTDDPDRILAEDVFGGLTVCRLGEIG